MRISDWGSDVCSSDLDAFRIGAFRRGGAGAVALIGPRDLRFRSTRGGAHMLKDSRGVALTATNQAAVDAFDRVVEAYLRFGRDTGLLLKRVAAEDPDMPIRSEAPRAGQRCFMTC